MSVAPHSGIIDFGTFTPPAGPTDGIQGEVPAPLSGQENYVLSGSGWSSLAALGTLTYQGTWDASTNTPTLVSSVGTQGYYYVVSVAGSTNLNGITTWGVGDWAIFNGTTWQKLEGGTTGNFTEVITPIVSSPTNNLILDTASDITTLKVQDDTSGTPASSTLWVTGQKSGLGRVSVKSSNALWFSSASTNNIQFNTNSSSTVGNDGSNQFAVSNTTSAVNYVQVTGSVTGSGGTISSQGSDANIPIFIQSKGTGWVEAKSNGRTAFVMYNPSSSAVNYLQVEGRTSGNAPTILANGSDTDISLGLTSKGNGGVVVTSSTTGVNGVLYIAGGTSGLEGGELRLNGSTGNDNSVIDNYTGLLRFFNSNGAQHRYYAEFRGDSYRFSLGGTANTVSEQFRINHIANAANFIIAQGSVTGSAPYIWVGGTDTNIPLNLSSKGTEAVNIFTNSGNQRQFVVSNTASAVNYVQVTGAATTGYPSVSATGSDATVNLGLAAKGGGNIYFFNNGVGTATQFATSFTANTVNYLTITGSGASGNAPRMYVQGSDTNISMVFQPKGTGAIDLAAGSSGVNVSNGGTVTAITRTAAGSGYTSVPTVAITAPTTAGGVQATATAQVVVNSVVSITSGGTGYTVGDVLTISGGTAPVQTTQLTVSTVSAGVITAVTITRYGTYTTTPTNPASVTGGTGAGATFTLDYAVQTGTFTITNAGSGYIEQPTVSFSGGGGSGASAYATVGSGTVVRSLGSAMNFYTPNGGINFAITDSGTSTSQGYLSVQGNNLNSINYASGGTTSNVGIYWVTKGNASHSFTTSSTTSTEQFRVSHTASAVNYVQVTGSATGFTPTISAQGSDSSMGLDITAKNAGAVSLRAAGGTNFTAYYTEVAPVNFLGATGSTSGREPILSARGSDTDISMVLQPKGTGTLDVTSAINVSNGNTVTAITRVGVGSGYTSSPTVAISAPNIAGGVQATATVEIGNTSATVASGGTGYTNGNVLTLVGGTYSGPIGTATVTGVSGGVVTSVTVDAAYTVAPTNPVATTGGSGTGCTLNITWGVRPNFTITNAGSGYTSVPTVTFSGGGGSGASAFAQVGTTAAIRGTAATLQLSTNMGAALDLTNYGQNQTTNRYALFASATGNPAIIEPRGDTNVDAIMSSRGTGNVRFFTNGASGGAAPEQMRVSHTASAVNYINATGATTGNGPFFRAVGSDSNIQFNFYTTGTGGYAFSTGASYAPQFFISHIASAVNYLQVSGGPTSGFPTISAQGSDANIGLNYRAKGIFNHNFMDGNGSLGFVVDITGANNGVATNYLSVTRGPTTRVPSLVSTGTDTDINLALRSKGAGSVDLVAGSQGINISNGTTITAITTVLRGSGFTALPVVTISAPNLTGSVVQATATAALNLNTATLVSGGTGYTVNDVLTFSGVTGGTVTVRVDTVSAGVITAFTITNFGAGSITAIPSNPVSVTGGTGTGATFNANWNCGNITVTNAGSGYTSPPTVTITGGTGATAYATVGSATIFRSLAGSAASQQSLSFNTPAGEAVRINDAGLTTDSYVAFKGGNSTSNGVYISALGTARNMYISSGAGQAISFFTGGEGSATQLRVSHTASAVNYVQVTGASTGSLPTISAQGSDTNIGFQYNTKGFAGSHRFQLGGSEAFRIEQFGATGVANRFSMFANVAGSPPMLVATGSDTNVGFDLSTKGTGVYRFYTNTANAGTGAEQFRIAHVASAVNYVQVYGAPTTGAVTIESAGSDANIWFNYGAKGTGRHQFLTNNAVQFQVAHTASADRYVQAQGGQAGVSAPGIGTAGGSEAFDVYSNANSIRFYTNGKGAAPQVFISHTASAVNYINLTGGSAGGAWPNISSLGSDTNIGMEFFAKGTGAFRFNSAGGTQQFRISSTASSVNFLEATGAVTGNYPNILATGADANVGMMLRMKGTPAGPGFRVENNSGSNVAFAVQVSGASLVNYVRADPSATGVATGISAQGSDTNINLALTPKGTGRVQYGTHTATADTAISGFIEILDAGGTIRKLAVIT